MSEGIARIEVYAPTGTMISGEARGRDAGRLITATEMRSRREHFRDWRQHHCTPELKKQLLRPFCLWDDFLIQFSFGTDATL